MFIFCVAYYLSFPGCWCTSVVRMSPPVSFWGFLGRQNGAMGGGAGRLVLCDVGKNNAVALPPRCLPSSCFCWARKATDLYSTGCWWRLLCYMCDEASRKLFGVPGGGTANGRTWRGNVCGIRSWHREDTAMIGLCAVGFSSKFVLKLRPKVMKLG